MTLHPSGSSLTTFKDRTQSPEVGRCPWCSEDMELILGMGRGGRMGVFFILIVLLGSSLALSERGN